MLIFLISHLETAACLLLLLLFFPCLPVLPRANTSNAYSLTQFHSAITAGLQNMNKFIVHWQSSVLCFCLVNVCVCVCTPY